MRGKIVFAVKDEQGRLYEIHNKEAEEFIDEIFWDNDGDAICEFEKVIVKTEGKIEFLANIKPI
jgi:F420-0:gamma-glutamyl ligase